MEISTFTATQLDLDKGICVVELHGVLTSVPSRMMIVSFYQTRIDAYCYLSYAPVRIIDSNIVHILAFVSYVTIRYHTGTTGHDHGSMQALRGCSPSRGSASAPNGGAGGVRRFGKAP